MMMMMMMMMMMIIIIIIIIIIIKLIRFFVCVFFQVSIGNSFRCVSDVCFMTSLV